MKIQFYMFYLWEHTKFGIKIFEIDFVIENYTDIWPFGASPRGEVKNVLSSPHAKFGWISSNGLEGDGISDRRWRSKYPLCFF